MIIGRSVTAEAAGSSPVVPANILKQLRIDGVFTVGAERCKSSRTAPGFAGKPKEFKVFRQVQIRCFARWQSGVE